MSKSHLEGPSLSLSLSFFFLKDFIYLFSERGEGRGKERERNIYGVVSCVLPTGTCPATQARALTGSQTLWFGGPRAVH